MRLTERAALHPARVAAGLVAVGTVTALLFCFLAYPRLQDAAGANLDPDQYGQIARNLFAGHGLALDPERGPTVYRGPGYPAFVCLALWVGGGAYPESVWVAQSVIHGVLTGLVFALGRRWFDTTVALGAAAFVSIYPALFWYAPRLWNESLLAVLLVAFLWLATRWLADARPADAVVAGLVLGVACLVKGIFLPWILLAPVALFWLRKSGPARSRPSRARGSLVPLLGMAAASCLCVLPWTYRNFEHTGRLIPVHTGAAFNLVVGQELSRDFRTSPAGYGRLWNQNIQEIFALTDELESRGPQREVEKEDIYRRHALQTAREHPARVVGHAAFAGASFWYLGETPRKTVLQLLLRLPVLLLGGWGLTRALRGSPPLRFAAGCVILYWLSHVPFAPPVRLSVPVLPVLCLFGAAVLGRAPFGGSERHHPVIGNQGRARGESAV